MRLLVQLAVIAVVEVATVSLLVWSLGALPAFIFYAIPTAIGFAIQLYRRKSMLTAWHEMSEALESEGARNFTRASPTSIAATMEHYLYWLATFLLLIPGPVTSIAAFYYMLPSNIASVQRLALAKSRDTAKMPEAPALPQPPDSTRPVVKRRKSRKRRSRSI